MANALLNKILSPGGISTVFQPIYKSDPTGFKPVILECLSRGPSGTNAAHAGVLFEYAQLKAAEPIVDRACVTTALESVKALDHPIGISLNVFAATLARDNTFVSWFAAQVNRLDLNPARLVFEIVESGEAWDADAFRRALNDIRALGSAIALDDVGLAHSNFQRILECDPDYLKLDQCIVRQCSRDVRRQALLRSLSILASDLDMRLIAEGVETRDELRTLIEFGLDRFQGFLFSAPLPASAILERLNLPALMNPIPPTSPTKVPTLIPHPAAIPSEYAITEDALTSGISHPHPENGGGRACHGKM